MLTTAQASNFIPSLLLCHWRLLTQIRLSKRFRRRNRMKCFLNYRRGINIDEINGPHSSVTMKTGESDITAICLYTTISLLSCHSETKLCRNHGNRWLWRHRFVTFASTKGVSLADCLWGTWFAILVYNSHAKFYPNILRSLRDGK